MRPGILVQSKERQPVQKKAFLKSIDLFTSQNIFIMFTAFMISRTTFFGDLRPFGIAYYAISEKYPINRKIIMIIVLAGTISTGDYNAFFCAFAAMIVFDLGMSVFRGGAGKSIWSYCIVSSLSFLISSIVIILIKGFVVYEVFVSFFNTLCIFFSAYIMAKYIWDIDSAETVKTNESLNQLGAGLILVLGLSIAGAGGIQIYDMRLDYILAGIIVLTMAWKLGTGYASSAGAAMGFLIALGNQSDIVVMAGLFAVGGTIAGILNKTRLGSALGYVILQLIAGIVSIGMISYDLNIVEVMAAPLIFLCIPEKVIGNIVDKQVRLVTQRIPDQSYYMRIQEITSQKLESWSKAFMKLSGTVGRFTKEQCNINTAAAAVILERTAERVCSGCSLSERCWGIQFYDTYRILTKVIERLERIGYVSFKDIEDQFKNCCIKLEKMTDQINQIYEMYRVEKLWRETMEENKRVLPKQISGISRLLSQLSQDVCLQYNFFHEFEDGIRAGLAKKGIRPEEIIVYRTRRERFFVEIVFKGCGGLRECTGRIENIIREEMGRPMVRMGTGCQMDKKGRRCRIQFAERRDLSVTTGVAQARSEINDVSGDCYTFLESEKGIYAIAISDGMGHGRQAEQQSSTAIQIMEDLIEAGFDREMIVYLINTLLYTETDQEKYATLDISFINLYDGNTEFIKIGAAPTFIKRRGRVESIHSVALPAGILENIEYEPTTKKLEDGDFVILMSDGIYDILAEKLGGKKEIIGWIKEIETFNPQEIADTIINKAKEDTADPNDDMTVLVSKVWRRG